MKINRRTLDDDHSHHRDGFQLATRYAIEKADWIWHSAAPQDRSCLCHFQCDFAAIPGEPLRLHLSADQHYECTINGNFLSSGPEAGDIEHWPFASFDLHDLKPGMHRIEAVVWWMGDDAPTARMSFRPGFILCAEGAYGPTLNTGTAPWTTRVSSRFSTSKSSAFGAAYSTHMDCRTTADEPSLPAVTLQAGLEPGLWRRIQLMKVPWQLTPARLDEQLRQDRTGGLIRAVLHQVPDDVAFKISTDAVGDAEVPTWQALIDQEVPLIIPPSTERCILWDLNDYVCGYPVIKVSGGAAASLAIMWDESLQKEPGAPWEPGNKGNRSQVVDKIFRNMCRDTFVLDGAPDMSVKPIWWRSGRYIAISIRTQHDPLTITSLHVTETRYPMGEDALYEAPIQDLASILQICRRSLEACSHDVFLDCPYYEQRMYVGDSLVESLISYTVQQDARLPRRSIELFDYSRAITPTGLTSARYPCREASNIPTFSMLWVWMVHDHHYWRDDPTFIRTCMVGIRAVLNALQPYRGDDHLLNHLPGRWFVDWAFPKGDPPGALESRSSIVNLIYLITLSKAAELETAHGHPDMAAFYRSQHADTLAETRRLFWNEARGCFADTPDHTQWSEQACILSLLSGILDKEDTRSTAEVLLHGDDLTRCGPYFRHFLFEAYQILGRGDRILDGLGFWRDCLELGLTTTTEQLPDRTRSDCHAWTAHPLFHVIASIAGIRPAAPGFREVRIAPSPGPLPHLYARVPHPYGTIDCRLSFAGTCCGTIVLPAGSTGTMIWQGKEVSLAPGENHIDIAKRDRF